jgi:hypothetical protein
MAFSLRRQNQDSQNAGQIGFLSFFIFSPSAFPITAKAAGARWVGSVRRDLLDHVIVLNQRHLRRLMKNYLRYYHEDRTHLGLGKDTPEGRVVASASPSGSKIISMPRLGGLHHRYTVAA